MTGKEILDKSPLSNDEKDKAIQIARGLNQAAFALGSMFAPETDFERYKLVIKTSIAILLAELEKYK